MNIFSNSPVPFLITDTNLRILWYNNKLSRLFDISSKIISIGVDKYFFRINKDKELVKNLFSSISSQKTSYFWQGRVKKNGLDRNSVITNMLILPIFQTLKEISKPIAYACIFDNISEEYKQILRITFNSLLEASRLKDNDTGNHIDRVNNYSKILANSLYKDPAFEQVNQEFIEDIGFLAGMHDVGKIGTPDDILNKPGPLDEWEWEIMKEHTINGAFILNTYPNPMAKEIALHHHERWDGTGYPHGWMENMIPLSARIVAIADVYDAFRMKRNYKQGVSHENAKNFIIERAGTHFDSRLIDQFIKIEKEFDTIFKELKD